VSRGALELELSPLCAIAVIDPQHASFDGSPGGRRKTLLPASGGNVRDDTLQRWTGRHQIRALQKFLDEHIPCRLIT
jgi:hypothetical protein